MGEMARDLRIAHENNDILRSRIEELEKAELDMVLWAAQWRPSEDGEPCDVCGSEEQSYGTEWQTFDQVSLGCTGTDCEWYCREHAIEKAKADMVTEKGE